MSSRLLPDRKEAFFIRPLAIAQQASPVRAMALRSTFGFKIITLA